MANRKTYGRQKSTQTRYRNNNQNQSNYQGNGGEYKKKSGAKLGYQKGEGNTPYVHGWNVSQARGYITFLAFPYKDTKRRVSENGIEWENWMLKITVRNTLEVILKPCLFEVATGRVLCKELNLIANPKAPNGGYFGKMI